MRVLHKRQEAFSAMAISRIITSESSKSPAERGARGITHCAKVSLRVHEALVAVPPLPVRLAVAARQHLKAAVPHAAGLAVGNQLLQVRDRVLGQPSVNSSEKWLGSAMKSPMRAGSCFASLIQLIAVASPAEARARMPSTAWRRRATRAALNAPRTMTKP